MKLSLAWIFDHIDTYDKNVDMSALMHLFNEKVAEIEGYYESNIDLASLYPAQVVSQDPCELFVPELNSTVNPAMREDIKLHRFYLLKKTNTGFRWAKESDFGGQKDTLLPALTFDEQDAKGGWRQTMQANDYVIDIDNKSVTHRPDMWGHRGCAREIALLLDLPMKLIDSMITPLPLENYATEVSATALQPFSARIITPEYADRFAFAYFSCIHNDSSIPLIASRLCRVGLRPIDLLVDATNYVMCDLGQPMHAFDANRISAKHIEIRTARPHEKLILLDDETIDLTEKDIVITDGTKPISLAGIMGGKETRTTPDTTAMLLESAHFDATTVRESAAHHKKRTESSARFEKTLDPNMNVIAIERYVRLLQDADVDFKVSSIASMGRNAEELVLSIEHSYIEKRLGTPISTEQVIAIFRGLHFQVTSNSSGNDIIYEVHVPTFRCTKDIRIKEDLLEEIARCFGYTHIPFVLPTKETKPSALHAVYAVRHIKQLLAYGTALHEVSNYSFYDELFLHELGWHPHNPIPVQSPVSENWRALVSSLIPGLLKNVVTNHTEHELLNFFEWGRVWHRENENIIERKQLAGICYDQKKAVSFYTVQSLIARLAHMLRLPIMWRKVDNPHEPWFAPYQTAHLMYGEIQIGTVGVLDIAFTHTVLQGHAAAFVLDGDFLINYVGTPMQFVPVSRFPTIRRDISMMVPLAITVESIKEALLQCSDRITEVSLLDVYQKEDWIDTKSLAFSYLIQDTHKTLTSEEADAVSALAVQAVKALGAQIR